VTQAADYDLVAKLLAGGGAPRTRSQKSRGGKLPIVR
jgi:hypothetical protein